MRVTGGSEQTFTAKVDFHLEVIFEDEAIKKGQNWDSFPPALKKWVADNALDLCYGSHDLKPIANLPFRLQVLKSKDRPRGIFFLRAAPTEDQSLAERIKDQLNKKVMKLEKYRGDYTTILLIENSGFPLIIRPTILSAIREACPEGRPDGVDEIWFVDIFNKAEFHDFTAEIVPVCNEPLPLQ